MMERGNVAKGAYGLSPLKQADIPPMGKSPMNPSQASRDMLGIKIHAR